MEEIWKDVPFAPGYRASNLGRIFGRRICRPLKQSENDRGYSVVTMNFIQYRVNRVICETFHGPPPSPQHHAAHKDGHKGNNCEGNLYWATPQQNSDDLVKHGQQVKGSDVVFSKLTEEHVRDIKERLARGESTTYIRDKFYSWVTHGAISHIKHGRSWRHI